MKRFMNSIYESRPLEKYTFIAQAGCRASHYILLDCCQCGMETTNTILWPRREGEA